MVYDRISIDYDIYYNTILFMNLSQYLINSEKEKLTELQLYRLNTIEFDHYFKYSGKQELNNKLIEVTPLYRVFEKHIPVNNDMKKYKLKKYYSRNLEL